MRTLKALLVAMLLFRVVVQLTLLGDLSTRLTETPIQETLLFRRITLILRIKISVLMLREI